LKECLKWIKIERKKIKVMIVKIPGKDTKFITNNFVVYPLSEIIRKLNHLRKIIVRDQEIAHKDIFIEIAIIILWLFYKIFKLFNLRF